MDSNDRDLIQTSAERILQSADLHSIDSTAASSTARDNLWATLEENGFTKICVAAAHGGTGASFADGLVLAGLCGRYALPLPLANTVLAGYLLSQTGITPPSGGIACIIPDGIMSRVNHAEQCSHAIDIVSRDKQPFLRLFALGDSEPLANGDDHVALFDSSTATLVQSIPTQTTARTYTALGALSRAVLMTGAMQSILELTLSYTTGREQFGRPLAKFQAIQHHLSDIASETAAATAAIELASEAIELNNNAIDCTANTELLNAIAVAKIRCGQAATRVAANAHQAHGAMGFTHDYPLGRYTRRLWQWQDEFGSETSWSIELGHHILDSNPPALWPLLSA
ncbi:hypothetical protein AB833_13465 [Chromatiales bacterium (ex Bugula neritina AB1)]|nr:hypothetical protein AB833_13465 [Chromatiales bacterium (ex Bugula neritina AB1)]